MSFNIERGLFKFDFADHHAVLGIPLDATANDIRKRYLKISRRLHPDSCGAESEAVKQQASQLFAKLVNPAYEHLYADQSRAEHNALLGRVGKRLIQEKDKIHIQSELAKKLSKAGNLDQEYKTALQSLVEKQYESIDQVLEQTAQISELNLVYLLRKGTQAGGGKPPEAAAKPPVAFAAAAGAPKAGAPAVEKKPEKVETTSPTDTYCRRAEEYLEKNYPAKAILEMKDALKMEPKSSRCHGIIAMAYYKSNQTKMAEIHLKNALQFNPEEPIALEVKKLLGKEAEKAAAAAKKKQQADKQTSSGGGLFGLFGKKTDKNEKKK